MQNIIKASLDYIDKNLKTGITAEKLAKTANYSVRHYCRLFSQTTGSSVASYIAKRRINSAVAESRFCSTKKRFTNGSKNQSAAISLPLSIPLRRSGP